MVVRHLLEHLLQNPSVRYVPLLIAQAPLLSSVRAARPRDAAFLRKMAVAAVSGDERLRVDDLGDVEHSAALRMVEGWPRDGDGGVIGVVGSVRWGASWYRLFEDAELRSPWADPNVPELAIAVRRHFRGRGMGTRLMQSLQERARTDGYHALDLEVSAVNKSALKLYRNIGFETLGSASPSALWMRLALD
jgi:ribosomal protein S18 acetylase RimI-like enzyme